MSRLYLSHFGLQKPPFELTPDGHFFYAGGQRGQLCDALLTLAAEKAGLVLIVGEVGSGKTMLARRFIEHLPDKIHSAFLLNPAFSRDEILLVIARDLGLPETVFQGLNRASGLFAIEQELLARQARGEHTVLVVDEAHLMPAPTLEEIRLLSNIETARGKALSIVLFAQPEIDDALGSHSMRQVRDRIVYRFEITRLPAQNVRDYLYFRLHQAGWRGDALFSPAAVRKIAKASKGSLRAINKLGDKALLAAYAEGAERVRYRHAVRAARELAQFSKPRGPVRWPAALVRAVLSWLGVSASPLTARKLTADVSTPLPPH